VRVSRELARAASSARRGGGKPFESDEGVFHFTQRYQKDLPNGNARGKTEALQDNAVVLARDALYTVLTRWRIEIEKYHYRLEDMFKPSTRRFAESLILRIALSWLVVSIASVWVQYLGVQVNWFMKSIWLIISMFYFWRINFPDSGNRKGRRG